MIDNWRTLWPTGLDWYTNYPKTNDAYRCFDNNRKTSGNDNVKDPYKRQSCNINLDRVETVYALFDGETDMQSCMLFGKLKDNKKKRTKGKYFYYSIYVLSGFTTYADFQYVLFDTKQQMEAYYKYQETVKDNQEGIYNFSSMFQSMCDHGNDVEDEHNIVDDHINTHYLNTNKPGDYTSVQQLFRIQ